MRADNTATLTIRDLLTIGLGPVIGVGWITGVGIWIAQAGPLGAVLAFLAGGFVVLLVGLCYAEMCSITDNYGGEIAYAERAFGRRGAFLAAWSLVLIYISALSFEGISFGWVVTALFPGLREAVAYRVFGQPVTQVALVSGLGGILLIAVVNYAGSTFAAGFQRGATYAKLALVLAVIVLGISFGQRANLTPLFIDTPRRSALHGWLLVVLTTPFWLAGFNAVTQAFSESSRQVSPRQMALVVLCSICAAIAFYCLIVVSISMSMPHASLVSLNLPAAGALDALLGSGAGRIALMAGLLGLFSAWNAIFFAMTRVLSDLSFRGYLPRWLALHGADHTTRRSSIVTCALLGAAGVASGRGAILPILDSASACIACVFALVAASMLMLRIRRRDLHRPFRVPAGPVVAVIALAASCTLVGLSIQQSLVEDGLAPVLGILGAWVFIGALLYVRLRRTVIPVTEATSARKY